MLRFEIWKIAIILLVLSVGITYALPNFFPSSPAVQISIDTTEGKISNQIAYKIYEQALETGYISDGFLWETPDEDGADSIVLVTDSYQDQLRLKEFLDKTLEPEFVIALNLATNTPGWLSNIGAFPMKLGLDLRGGVHFLLEVDSNLLISTRLESYLSDIRRKLREQRFSVSEAEISDGKITIKTRRSVSKELNEYIKTNIDLKLSEEGENTYVLEYSDAGLDELIDYAVSQNLITLRNRVNELGISEPVVLRQGKNRISVQLPGVQDTAEAKK